MRDFRETHREGALTLAKDSAALHGEVGGTHWGVMQCTTGSPEVHGAPYVPQA